MTSEAMTSETIHFDWFSYPTSIIVGDAYQESIQPFQASSGITEANDF